MSSLTPKDLKDLQLMLKFKFGLYCTFICSKAKDILDLKIYVGAQTAIMANLKSLWP